jgi:hypothetical protein
MTSESIEIRSQRADTQIPNFSSSGRGLRSVAPHYGARSLELLPEREGGKVLISLTPVAVQLNSLSILKGLDFDGDVGLFQGPIFS